MHTAMARSSGTAADNLIAGEFTHKKSGVHYSIYQENGKAWLSFERPGDPLVHGRRELLYYIGEGRRGRTYLFSVDGFVFESPVNWYADRKVWDMAPAYGNAREGPLNLPATTGCLNCHMSGIRPPRQGTENEYPTPVFFYSGVTCERCHGPGAAHVNGGKVVNPVKLPANLRDQVCMQCHLEGNAAIERAGKHLYEYSPGQDLSSFVRYFVTSGGGKKNLRATSQFEALAQSACKKKSGDSMSCVSCHNPHKTVAKENRVAHYRAICIACHGEAFAEKHHVSQRDCTLCHMPASLSSDVAHTEVTDHRILRTPRTGPATSESRTALEPLVPFPPTEEARKDVRDLALAWQTVAEGVPAAQPEAELLLTEALHASPGDPALLSGLAYIDQRRGETQQASALYERALKIDPTSVDAATDLGVLDASQGRLAEAVKLWQPAFERAPERSAIGMNLAYAFCGVSQFTEARNYVLRVLRFNPDLGAAKKLLHKLNGTPPHCGP